MAEIQSFPNNTDEYIGAEQVMRWLHGRTSGVFGADGEFSVTAVSGAMAAELSDGVGWMSNAQGDGIVFWVDAKKKSGSPLRLGFDIADAVLPRIDRIAVSWDTVDYVAKPEVIVLKGVPASAPKAPDLTNTNLKRQISFARINIPAGTSSLTAAMITDERLDAAVCGIVSGGVRIPTDTITAQATSLISTLQKALADVQDGAYYAHVDNFTATLPAAGWSATAPYTQTVTVQGMVDTMEPICDIVLTGTAADAAALEAYACVSRIASGANSITATCLEDKPGAAINLKFKVVR